MKITLFSTLLALTFASKPQGCDHAMRQYEEFPGSIYAPNIAVWRANDDDMGTPASLVVFAPIFLTLLAFIALLFLDKTTYKF